MEKINNEGKLKEITKGLDEYQKVAVEFDPNQNLLCNAIAGSGKTHVLTTRVSWLIANGVKQESILLLTFTNKAANEMSERVSQKFDNQKIKIKSGTFHSVAVRYLRIYGPYLGYKNNFSILDSQDAQSLIAQIRTGYIEDLNLSKEDKKAFPKAAFIHNLYSKSININKHIDDFEAVDEKYMDDVKNIIREYIFMKRKANLMDFDDLIINFDAILKIDSIRERIQQQIKYVLVDEFQDINHIQASIIKNISGGKNLFVVGDASQSIYGFRGSDVSYIQNFTEDYIASEVTLKKNYRSDKNILELAENVINKNPQKKPVEMIPFKKTDFEQDYTEYDNEFDEISMIINKIRELQDEGIEKKDICILLRSMNRNGYLLEGYLRKSGIPYDLRAGFSYFDKAHIKDIIAILTLVVNKTCVVSFNRVMGLLDGVGYKTALKAYDFYDQHDFSFKNMHEHINEFKGSKRAKESLTQISELFISIEQMEDVEDIINTINNNFYLEYFEKKYSKDEDYETKFEEVISFVNMNTANDLVSFLEDITLDSEVLEGENKDDSDKIIVSTMHRAKGLEWDYVFIPFLNMGYFPRSLKDESEVEEERRLYYVALTRGCKKLYISNHEVSTSQGYLEPSIFLEEMDE